MCAGFHAFGAKNLYLVFLDEFGHIGPFKSRNDPRYNQSPVFGLAGYIIPHRNARSFATWFYQLKENVLSRELRQITVHPATWEKKGTDLFTTKSVKKHKKLLETASRIANKIYKLDGRFFYYGREKYLSPEQSHPTGLYTTILSHTIRQTDRYVAAQKSQYMMILDQHQDRINLLATAAKTMFGDEPARTLIEPPFHVESHLYQTIQAADWIACLIGRSLAYQVSTTEYADWEWANTLFLSKINDYSTHSSLWRPSDRQRDPRASAL